MNVLYISNPLNIKKNTLFSFLTKYLKDHGFKACYYKRGCRFLGEPVQWRDDGGSHSDP